MKDTHLLVRPDRDGEPARPAVAISILSLGGSSFRDQAGLVLRNAPACRQSAIKMLGSVPACFKIARSVPSGMSPEWWGIVVYRLVAGLNRIFVTAGGLAIKLEAARLQFSHYLPITESRELPSSGCDYHSSIAPLFRTGKTCE